MGEIVTFSEHELKALQEHPAALEAAADYNDCRESEADAQGYDSCAEHHKARAHYLRAKAAAIQRRDYE